MKKVGSFCSIGVLRGFAGKSDYPRVAAARKATTHEQK
jgi:hypothetical protein